MSAVTPGITSSELRASIDSKAPLARAANASPGVNINTTGHAGINLAVNKPLATLRLNVPYYSQLDPQWADSFTVGYSHNIGCLITSISMVLAYYGCLDDNRQPVTPATLYKYLQDRNALSTGGAVLPCDFTFGGNTYRRNKGKPIQLTALNDALLEQLTSKMPALVTVIQQNGKQHHVVVVGLLSDGTHLMNDPGRASGMGDGADSDGAVLTGDIILEPTNKAHSKRYRPESVDTIDLV